MKQRKEARDPITNEMSMWDLVTTMSEGNPGAITAMMMLIQSTKLGIIGVLHLDDMNIRGPMIWVGFKDWAGQDIEKFAKGIKERDPEMISAINEEMAMDPSYPYRAVVGGASRER